MRNPIPFRWALTILALLARPVAASDISEPFPRRNPIVAAVEKTKNSIVIIKVTRPGSARALIGSGVIIDERGYILTNRHVVGTSASVRARLFDGTELVASVIWRAAAYDLAVVRVQTAKKLQALELAPVGDLMLGETVIAIGHPYGFTNTISTGIISALGREITMPSGDTLSGLIQTNASINPGNSGGPLLNINGELIGINVALRDGAQGIAFAINAGTVERALSQNLSALKIAGVDHGLLCKEIILGETGDRQRVVVAGFNGMTKELFSGDEILAVGDRPVRNAFDVERAMWDKPAGGAVNLKVLRHGQELNLTLVLPAGAKGAQTTPKITGAAAGVGRRRRKT